MSLSTQVRRTLWREPALLTPDQLAICDHPLLAALLQARGVATRAAADAFLRPSRQPLGDPAALPDLERAAGMVESAIARGERIAIFGDYDVDGLTSTALLTRLLRRLGADPLYDVPHRIQDGYGLNRAAAQRLADAGARLLIAVDCGSSNAPELEYALERNMQAIVLDHHQLADDLPPEVAFVSALRSANAYPARDLTGVGLAYTLARRLLGDGDAEMYLPYVALGTIADVADLRGENRTLAAKGLRRMLRWTLPGIVALCDAAGVEQASLRAWDIGYTLAPRLNAAGRIDSPQIALDLLLADTLEQATPLARKLSELNARRQEDTRRALDEAEEQIAAGDLLRYAAIVVSDPGWSIGIAGLVASRLAERHDRPAFVLERGTVDSRGSARSFVAVDLMAALRETAPLLERFGGHRRAAGLALPTAKIDLFREAISAALLGACGGALPASELALDAELGHDDLTLDTVALLNALEPFGAGNPTPIFLVRNLVPRDCRVSANGRHLLFQAADRRDVAHGAVFFGAGDRLDELNACRRVDLAVSLRRDDWNGRTRLKLFVEDFRCAE